MSQWKKCFVLSAVILFAAISVMAQQLQKMSRDETAVRQIVQQLQDGWNTHNSKAFAAPFAEDADYVIVNGMQAKGREAIEKGHTDLFTTIYKDSRNNATVKSVRFLRPDVALVHVQWVLEFQAGGETRKASATCTMVMTNDKGKWSIAAFQNTPIQTETR